MAAAKTDALPDPAAGDRQGLSDLGNIFDRAMAMINQSQTTNQQVAQTIGDDENSGAVQALSRDQPAKQAAGSTSQASGQDNSAASGVGGLTDLIGGLHSLFNGGGSGAKAAAGSGGLADMMGGGASAQSAPAAAPAKSSGGGILDVVGKVASVIGTILAFL